MVYDPETGKMISKYDLYFKRKAAKGALDKEMASGAVVDESGPIAPGEVESGKMTQAEFDEASLAPGGVNESLASKTSGAQYGDSAMAAGKTAASGGNVEDIAAAGLMAAPNPYAKAAGLGLMTLSAINKQKQQNKIDRYNAEVARIKARQDAINKMAQIGQSLKV